MKIMQQITGWQKLSMMAILVGMILSGCSSQSALYMAFPPFVGVYYLANVEEQLPIVDYVNNYILYQDSTLTVLMDSPSHLKKHERASYSLRVFYTGQDKLMVKDMDIKLVDKLAKREIQHQTIRITSPAGKFENKAFASLPDSCRQTTSRGAYSIYLQEIPVAAVKVGSIYTDRQYQYQNLRIAREDGMTVLGQGITDQRWFSLAKLTDWAELEDINQIYVHCFVDLNVDGKPLRIDKMVYMQQFNQ